MTTLLDDLRMAIRRLRHQPGFTSVAVLTLALGLGANLTIFTLVDALMLRSLPVERPGELVRLGDNTNCCVNSGLQGDYSLFSLRLFEHLRASTPGFTELAGFQANTTPVGIRRAGVATAAESLPSQFVTGNYFTMFGVKPAAGRVLERDDDRPGAAPVAVMSHQAWTRQYGRDPSIIGETLLISGRPITIVGVTSPEFFGDTIRPDPTGVWIPISQEPLLRGDASIIDRPDQDWLYAIGRISADASATQIASAATAALQAWLSSQSFVSEANRPAIVRQRIPVAPGGGGVGAMAVTFSRPLNVLLITSALVLLIASANLANLLLARADRGQAAIQAALGASAGRILRQALTEGVVLSLAGGLVGLLVAANTTGVLVALAFPGAVFVPLSTTPSLGVVLFGLTLAVITGALFSAGPAWAMSRTAPLDALHGVGRGAVERSFVPRGSLVVAQVALSLVLLCGAGLLARSLGNLEAQPLGFEPANRVVVRINPPMLAGEPDRLAEVYARLQTSLRQIPGVVNASYALYSPMEGNNWSSGISLQGRAVDPAQPDFSSWNRVGPGYFDTVGTRVVRGRALDERDRPGAARAAVVNQAFVRRLFEGADPLGRRVGLGDTSHGGDFEIVGVVEDVKYTAASEPVRPMLFLPALQQVEYAAATERSVQARSTLLRAVVVRTADDAGTLEPALRRALAEVDPNLTVVNVRSLVDQVKANFRTSRLMARLTSTYSLLALALASLGLYGVTAYGVTRRTREIAIRMALGADRPQIIRTMMRGPVLQTSIGLAIGLPLAVLAGRAIGTQLYGTSGQDPTVLGVATVVLIVSALCAAVGPARRAASVDPARALR